MVTIQAPAKLNLSLAVLERRQDGYHEIESLMVPVTLHDTLSLRPRPDGDVRLAVRFGGNLMRLAAAPLRHDVPGDRSNLVVRAVRLLAAETGERCGLDIELVKEIPAGSGLGGGSSDAAAALVGAARVWGVAWPQDRLTALAARLGSDVPFFLAGGPAIATGRGESLERVDGLPPLNVVIARPSTGLSTAAVYARCSPAAARRGGAAAAAARLSLGDVRGCLATMDNSLEPPARALCADVGRLLDEMAAAGAVRPMLTGSGSACFCLTRSREEAEGIAVRLEAAGWPWVVVSSVMPAAAHTIC